MVTRKQARKSTRTASNGAQRRMLSALHEIWLAGLGAVVRAQRGAPKLLEELVAEGARFQSKQQRVAERTFQQLVGDAKVRLQTGLGQARGQANEALENLEKVFQSRVHRALAQLGVPNAQELAVLGKRVDSLSQSVDRLARHPAARSRPRANPRRRAASPPAVSSPTVP